MNKEKVQVSHNIRLWPILYTFGCDLFFFWVINVAFMTGIKGLSYQEFFMLDIIAAGVDLLTAIPCLYLVAKLGNNASLRVAAFLLILSSVLFTFGNAYWVFIIATVAYYKAYQFFIVYPVILENNLEKYGIKNQFTPISARGRLGYSALSLAVAFVAGFLFDVNAYLPMYLCIGLTVAAFITTFFIRDETKGKYEATKVLARPSVKLDKKFIIFTVAFLALIVVFKGCWCIGNNYTKVSLQEIGVMIELLTIVIFVARAIRVIVNLFAEKILKRFKFSLSYILPILLTLGLLLMAIPLVFIKDFTLQLALICVGIVLIFSIHDLYKLHIHEIIVEQYPKEMHLRMFWFIIVFESLGILCSSIVITTAVANLSVGFALLALGGVSLLALLAGLYMCLGFFRQKKKELIDYKEEL